MLRHISRSGRFTKILLSASAISALIISVPAARASELFSESVDVPPFPTYADGATVDGWNSFGILLAANANLPVQSATDTNTDPYAVNGTSTITDDPAYAYAGEQGIWVGPGPVTLDDLQRLRFAGNVPISQSSIPNQNVGNPENQVQFGIVGPTDNSPMELDGQHWIGNYHFPPLSGISETYLRSVPVVTVIPHPAPPANPPAGQSFQYIVDYISFTQDGISGTEWAEFPYLTGDQPAFTYGGWADPADPIHFTDTEIQLSNGLIPLDDLNFANDPLGGSVSSGLEAFAPQANPADITVAIPEPASVGILATGAITLLARRRRLSHGH
jgi:hypothetical protein